MQNNSLSISASIAMFAFALLYFYTNISFYSTLGIVQFVFFISKFFFDLGKKIEIRDIMILLATLQWVIGPILSYLFVIDDPIFYMSVDEKTYMSFAFPANLTFAIGLYLPLWPKKLDENAIFNQIKQTLEKYPNLDLLFIGGGLFLNLTEKFYPSVLGFFVYLLASIRFIGLYLLILRNRPYKWVIFSLVILSFASLSLANAMFHDFLLWLSFMVIIIAFIYKFSNIQKIILFLGGLFLILSIQLVKGQFRSLNQEERTIGQFYDMASESYNADASIFTDVFIQYNINRLNQGWIISRIMYNVPLFEPFADGETIWRGIKASLVPRFLNPEIKTFVGFSEYFYRFTGLKLAYGTSMDISIMGEAYANYGVNGGVFFMLILGLFYNFILSRIFIYSVNTPTLILMIPLMFLQVVKAETDFTSSMNYLVKAIMVVFMIYFGLRKMLGMNI